MKKDELPQDDANIFEGKTRDLQYIVDENGNYTTGKSIGWETKNNILQQTWEELDLIAEEAKEQVLMGKKSPIYYFMVRNQMNIALLGEYVGINRFRVWLHLKPKRFRKLSNDLLLKYVDAFRLSSIDELLKFEKHYR